MIRPSVYNPKAYSEKNYHVRGGRNPAEGIEVAACVLIIKMGLLPEAEI